MSKLTQEDEKVIKYLSKYKIMLVEDTKIIYKSEWYHRKRIKRLIEDGYVKKYKFYYIELDRNGRRFVGKVGKDYIKNKNNVSYMERLKELSHLATMTIDSNVEINPSWEMKDNNIFTDTARKYLAEMIVNNQKYLIYYISEKKEKRYIHQLFYDINKVFNYDSIIIFIDDFKNIMDEQDYMYFNKEHTYLIKNSSFNRKLLTKFNEIDFYEIINKEYEEKKELLISDWKLADYYLDEDYYIINMIFIDMQRLNEINWFYRENENTNKHIDIFTLEGNKEFIEKAIHKDKRCRIITLENNKLLEGENNGHTQQVKEI